MSEYCDLPAFYRVAVVLLIGFVASGCEQKKMKVELHCPKVIIVIETSESITPGSFEGAEDCYVVVRPAPRAELRKKS